MELYDKIRSKISVLTQSFSHETEQSHDERDTGDLSEGKALTAKRVLSAGAVLVGIGMILRNALPGAPEDTVVQLSYALGGWGLGMAGIVGAASTVDNAEEILGEEDIDPEIVTPI